MKIITVTLNPAFDIHCNVQEFKPYHENLAHITSNDAGGKGINISRALTASGIKSTALVVLGTDNGKSFENALKNEHINYCKIYVKGRIRENITCHSEGVPETRISFPGFNVDSSILTRVFNLLLPETDADTVITFTGRVPEGISIKRVKSFLKDLSEKGARIVIDSRSFSLVDLQELKPWLIKPNQEEISEYLGREINGFDDAEAASEELHKSGIDNVMISMGESGAMLVCDGGVFVASPPKINAISTIGAGDSTIAGFLAAIAKDTNSAEALRLAVAYGSAACMTEGTKPPQKNDIETLFPLVKLKRIK